MDTSTKQYIKSLHKFYEHIEQKMQDERVIFRMSDAMNISMDAAKKLCFMFEHYSSEIFSNDKLYIALIFYKY